MPAFIQGDQANPYGIYGTRAPLQAPQQQQPQMDPRLRTAMNDPSHPERYWQFSGSSQEEQNAISRYPYYGGSQWNGQAWVPYNQNERAVAYSNPYSMPNTYEQYKANIRSNPLFRLAADTDPTSTQSAMLGSMLAEEKANADTERNFGNALGALNQGQAGRAGMFDQAERSSLSDARRAYGQATGNTAASMAGRGLYNTTLMNAMQNRKAEAYGRTAGNIRGNYAQQRGENAYGYGKDVATLWGSRQSSGANQAMFQNLLAAKGMSRTPAAQSQSGGDNGLWGSIAGAVGSLGAAGILALAL